MEDNLKMFGHVVMSERKVGCDSWKKIDEFDNVVTTVGKQTTIYLLQSGTGPFIGYFGVGSGAIAESTGDVDNTYPVDISSAANPHKLFDSVVNNGKSLKYTCILTTAQPSVQPVTISEIALFSAISGGSCFTHVTHTGYSKTNQVELKYDYTVGFK